MAFFIFIITVALTLVIWLNILPKLSVYLLPLSILLTAVFFGLICLFCAAFGTRRAMFEAWRKMSFHFEQAERKGDWEYLLAFGQALLATGLYGGTAEEYYPTSNEDEIDNWLLARTKKVGDGLLGTFIIWLLAQIASTVLLEMGDSARPTGEVPDAQDQPEPQYEGGKETLV
jgi:hypothetical protein